jgi:D-arabinose 1-dehydrogenase-like Zn-dependent alcohol dehydrogenase
MKEVHRKATYQEQFAVMSLRELSQESALELAISDRVIIYHISGCGLCKDCRQGFMISCSNDNYRKSYGFQRNGGMAPFVLAEEKVCNEPIK